MKLLKEVYKKYHPETDRFAELMELGTVLSSRADKDNRLLESVVSFPRVIPKPTLYALEDELRLAYDLNSVRLLPKYEESQFDEKYIADLVMETERTGIVARGFFGNYRYRLNGDKLTFEVPFSDGGVYLLEDAKTHEVMENILRSEFGLNFHVSIEHSDAFPKNSTGLGLIDGRLQVLDSELVTANTEYERALSSKDYAAAGTDRQEAEAALALPRIPSVYEGQDPTPVMEDGAICRIGQSRFDLSSPELIEGRMFEIRPMPIAGLSTPQRDVTIIGVVTGFTAESNRTGDKINITFGVFDGNATMEVKAYNRLPEDAKEFSGKVKNGMAIALHGYVKYEMHREKRDTDLTFFHDSILKISKVTRKDNAPEKRVELHLHTNMSQMDALTPPDAAVKIAKAWGHKAIAITDHGNVQGYQEAMLASEKVGQPVIYGIEAYFVNDTSGALFGEYSGTFQDELVVFDIETTGLSAANNRITEIGAVRVKDGQVLETFNMLVNPECPIPEEIVKLTGITDEMVRDQPTIEEVLPKFFEFTGNRLLIAHNADFDTGFIRYSAKRLGLPFDNPYFDTLALSRFLNPELKNHKLDTLANYFGLGDFNHHRASDDAEMLAMIYFAMVEKMRSREIHTFADLRNEMSTNTDVLRLPTYHQIILVKNRTGLKNLYRLISFSYLNYFRKVPRIPKTQLEKYREGLIIGSACEAGELMRAIIEGKPDSEIEEIAKFYDYLEIQPISNNRFMVAEGRFKDEEDLRDLNRRVVALGEKLNKPVVATCDSHFLEKSDELYRKILTGVKFGDNQADSELYLRTTEEMLEEFSYLGKEKAYEVVVKNTNLIADQIDYENIRPFPKGTFTPDLPGAKEDLPRICYERARSMYGDPLPKIVEERLNKELTSIIEHGFAVLYMIAHKLVWYSESQGYLVGSRGSVGSSLVASMAGISEVNPLPPHYWCPECKYSDFETAKKKNIRSGFDLPDAVCPRCGHKLNYDGHDIPFETFLGFYGDKSPDIDLNFSGEVQGKVHKYTEELFGAENVFRAGTIGGLADKTAYGYVLKYLEGKGVSASRAEMNRLVSHLVGVKRNTGQHPGGIVVVPKEYEIYDFCPVQHPADDPNSNIVTTHFTFEYLHDTLLKLDELGHDIPTKYRYLEKFSGTRVLDVPMNDRSIYDLFLSTKPLKITEDDIDCPLGTLGLPELGTRFVIKMLQECKPQSFADLLQISGLSHGTDVWTNNAQDLIKEGICDISHVIGCRDNIMLDLIGYGVDKAHSFKIMEMVRKGKGLTPEYEQEMKDAGVPDWYIGSCKKIKYMFPKAHAAAYDMSAIRMGWYKVHIPLAFYCTMFTVSPEGFDAELVMQGKNAVFSKIRQVEKDGFNAQPKDIQGLPTLQLVNEAMARGIRFLPVDIVKSHATEYIPEDGKIRMPFSSLAGVGANAAIAVMQAREEEPFFSVEDMQIRSKVNKNVIDTFRRNHVLDSLHETDQLSFF